MATSFLDGVAITNLDATPVVPQDVGEGMPGNLREVDDYVVALSSDSIGSIYRIIRIPTNAKVKSLQIYTGAGSNGAADVDVLYSDSTVDGTNISNQGSVVQVSSADNKMFGTASTLVTTGTTYTEITFSGNFTVADMHEPLWVALGLSNDPGGRFDIGLKLTTAITTGGTIGLKMTFVE